MIRNSLSGFLTHTPVPSVFLEKRDIELQDLVQHASPSVPYKEVSEQTGASDGPWFRGKLHVDGRVHHFDFHCN